MVPHGASNLIIPVLPLPCSQARPPGWLFSLFPSHSRTRTTRGEAAAARGTEKAPAGRSRGELRADQVINGAAACG
jgi:hypothetical protein